MMLTRDLPDLFGIVACPANKRVKVRHLPQFSHWLHVISNHVMVRFYASSSEVSMLSRNQVNVPVSIMPDALHTLKFER